MVDGKRDERGDLPGIGVTPDATPTVDLGPGGAVRAAPVVESAFDPMANRFEAVAELGRGGMGRVDDAFDRALGRPVAIKHMLSDGAVDLARFEREARITARLEHPGIVPIHDAGRSPDGTPYYVMRRIDGQPLDKLVTKSLAERLALIPNVLAACDAVGFAHARRIVHRDLKPSNILVGPFGETLVIDWGLAREIGDSELGGAAIPSSNPQLTRVGTIAGTPGFMSPEQARGEAVDARADVFALGATLFYVLSGQLPYGSASATEMVGLAGAGRAPDWTRLPDDVPADLRAIAIKAMASDANERYLDAGALAGDLRRFITGNLVGAYDYGLFARLARFARRHRAALAVAVISAVVVLAVAVLSVRRIVAERDDATRSRELAERRQHDAISVADSMLVKHARELADTDPMAAIAVLRTLAPESTRWHEARVAAAEAYLHGIPFGFANDHESNQVQIRLDGRAAIVAAWREGHVAVIDLIARTRHVVGVVGRSMLAATWLGPDHIACAYRDRLVIVEVATGATARTIPGEIDRLIGDHGSKIWLLMHDRRVLQLDDPAGEPRELLAGIDGITPASDLTEAVIARGDVISVWTPAKEFYLLDNPHPGASWVVPAAIRGNHVVLIGDDAIRRWHLDGANLIEDRKVAGTHLLSILLVGDQVYAFGYEGMSMIDGNKLVQLGDLGMPSATPRGLVQFTKASAIRIIDERGTFGLGRQAAAFRIADASADGRFVIALTDNGDAMIWDLEHLRPISFSLDGGDAFGSMTEHYLWLRSMVDGITRVDLATGRRESVIHQPSTNVTLFDRKERWVASFFGKTMYIHDFTTNRELAFPAVTATPDGVGITLERDDATVWRWRPGNETLAQIAKLDHVVNALDANGDYVIALLDETHVARLDIRTHVLETIASTTGFTRIGGTPSGRAWLLEGGGTGILWDVGETPIRIEMPEPLDDLTFNVETGSVVLYNHKAITVLGYQGRTITPIASSMYSWASTDSLAVLDPHRNIRILDLSSGSSFQLPSTFDDEDLVALDHRVATFGGVNGWHQVGEVWNVDVPDDPVALQHWLTTVTNARGIPNTEAYAWQ